MCNANAQLAPLKKFWRNLQYYHRFCVLKKTAEKISSLGLKKLFFGVTVGAMLSEAYNNPVNKENKNFEILQDRK